MDDQKAYQILGIPADSTLDTVKSAWKKKCVENHPDRGGDQKVFIEIMRAYEWITDPSTRYKQIAASGPDLTMTLQYVVSFEEMFFGKELAVSFNKIEIDAKHNVIRRDKEDLHTVMVKLPEGFGSVHTVELPGVGIRHGTRLGDCRLVFKTQPHRRFNVDHGNIVVEEHLPLDVMIKGGKIEVETMYGMKQLRVLPGAMPGSTIEIKKAGVNRKGSHVCIVIPKFPNQEELRKDAWKGLGINWNLTDEDEVFEEDMLALLSKLTSQTPP